MPRKKRRLPFHYLEPAFFGGLLDDPLLFLRIRPLRRALLFDCGQIAHLAKRVVKAIDTVFITHAHMDHVMGIPTLVRHHHASPRTLDIYGPPGIAERVHHQLLGYDWNLSEPNWFTLRVHEIHQERVCHYRFIGPEGFRRRSDGEEPRTGSEIWSCRYVSVDAELFDHKLPVLAFRIWEKLCFTVDPQRLKSQGLVPGGWIRDMKNRMLQGGTEFPVVVTRYREGGMIQEVVTDIPALYDAIRGHPASVSMGYLCDVGWTPGNIPKAIEFFRGVTLLCADCTFLAADLNKARASYHFSTTDLNRLTALITPGYLLPMHLSKSYLHRTFDLYPELCPPPGTVILRLPKHVVPAPLMVEDVAGWLKVP